MTAKVPALAVCVLLAAAGAGAQTMPIGIVDFYGLGGVPVDRLRAALTFQEGDTVSFAGTKEPAFIAASEARLMAVPGVRRARINLVCCDSGRAIAYVGIEGTGTREASFRGAPGGDARLPAAVARAGDEFLNALMLAVQRGDVAEDRSRGHALNHDPAMRALQDSFIVYARTGLPLLRRVLRTSSNAGDRALAAQILGYAPDKAAVVDDLVFGMGDPDQEVRNRSMRALLVIAEMKPGPGQSVPPIPATPFIALLNSPVWTDRNKASGALEALTRHRDPGLFRALRRQAIPPLVEIARWRSEGHALPGFLVLARLAGYSDQAALELWKRGDRETVIQAVVAGD